MDCPRKKHLTCDTLSCFSFFNVQHGSMGFCRMAKLVLVVTLALGSRPKQRLVKMQAKKEAQESHFMVLGVQENVRE